jgi:putative protease
MAGIRVGEVTHFFDRLSVAVLKLTEPIRLGDTLHVLGHHTDFRQKLESMQIEHQEVTEARPGQDVAVKLAQKVHPGDTVFKVSGEE